MRSVRIVVDSPSTRRLPAIIAVLLSGVTVAALLAAPSEAALSWHLRNSNTTGPSNVPVFQFGNNADTPVPSDWNNNGTDTVGVFQPGGWWRMRNSNTAGPFDASWLWGQQPGDKPVPASWGNWLWDVPGIVRGNQWIYPDPAGQGGQNLGSYGLASDRPLATGNVYPIRVVVRNIGAWRWFLGCCTALDYGTGASQVPVLGDWDGNGSDTPGVYIPSVGQWHLNNSWADNIADIAFTYAGPAGARPVTGDWNGDGVDTIGLVIPN